MLRSRNKNRPEARFCFGWSGTELSCLIQTLKKLGSKAHCSVFSQEPGPVGAGAEPSAAKEGRGDGEGPAQHVQQEGGHRYPPSTGL